MSLSISVIKGESYTVRLTVANQSTMGGSPVSATLEVVCTANTAYEYLISITANDEYFTAGESREFDYAMDIPIGIIGREGQIIAVVNDPAGTRIAWVMEELVIYEGAVPLTTGWNEVTYTGSRKRADIAFQSIANYLGTVYYLDVDGYWNLVLDDTMLEPGMYLAIEVTQDCTWFF